MYSIAERPRKRAVQRYLAARIDTLTQKYPSLRQGTIIVLAGPQPQEAIKYYEQYNLYTKCLLVEKDSLQILRGLAYDDDITLTQLHKRWRENANDILFRPGIYLKHCDVYDFIDEPRDDICGIDLDLCSTLNLQTVEQTISLLKNIHSPIYWFRLTTSYRAISKQIVGQRIAAIRNTVAGYDIIEESSRGYRDGTPMNCWQVILKKRAEYTPVRGIP